MGVDLKLLPLNGPDHWASFSLLELERRRELWPAVDKLPQQIIPQPLSCYVATTKDGERGYGQAVDTPYGDRMKYTTVAHLLTLAEHPAVLDNWQNRAVWAYLAQMPQDWKIVLYWH